MVNAKDEKSYAKLTTYQYSREPQSASSTQKRAKLNHDTHSSGSKAIQSTGSTHFSRVRNSGLWADKYSPKTLQELVGNSTGISALRSWLKSWQNLNISSRNSFRKAVLISGPPGIGKTTTAALVCSEFGLQVLSVNASDTRGKCSSVGDGVDGMLASKIREFVTNKHIHSSNNAETCLSSALIMDEVDGMGSGERGGISELIDTIKRTRVPIICICNDRYSQKLKSLMNYCLDIPFQRPNKLTVRKRLLEVAQLEGLHVDTDVLESLIELNHNDLRASINQMQLWSMDINRTSLTKRVSKKDMTTSVFQAVDALFQFKPVEPLDSLSNSVFQHMDLLPLFVQENYVQMRPVLCGSELHRLDLMAVAAARVSEGDVFTTYMNRTQAWTLMTPNGVLACILPAAAMRGNREVYGQGERNFHRFPSLLGKISKKNKTERLFDEITKNLRSSGCSHVTTAEFIMRYAFLMKRLLTFPLFSKQRGGNEIEGISKVVSFMRDYNLSKDDWLNMQELTIFSGKGPVFDAPGTHIPTSVKSSFTRACKREKIRN